MSHSICLTSVGQSFSTKAMQSSDSKKSAQKSSTKITLNQKSSTVNLFEQLNLTLNQGESYAITGPSGAGKSSLLMIASGLEQPTSGQVHYQQDGQNLPMSALREGIGYIFQQFHLLPELNALNNVALPLKLRGDKNAISKAKEILEQVGLAHRIEHMPSELSGGEQQRVAIARALVFKPRFIFADEPTGNLDRKNAQEIADTLFDCCHRYGAALVIVTHSDALAARATHRYGLDDGKLTAQVAAQFEQIA